MLLVREIAGVNQWNDTSDVKHHSEQATNKLNMSLTETIGIKPSLMFPGNYAISCSPLSMNPTIFISFYLKKETEFFKDTNFIAIHAQNIQLKKA